MEKEKYERKAKEEKGKLRRGRPANELNKFRMDNVGNIIAVSIPNTHQHLQVLIEKNNFNLMNNVTMFTII